MKLLQEQSIGWEPSLQNFGGQAGRKRALAGCSGLYLGGRRDFDLGAGRVIWPPT